MENYLKCAVVGRGTYGTVYKAKCLITGEMCAVKYHNLGVDDTTVRELSCLAALRGHPHVIRMQDCFVDNGKIAMVMPYVPYTLSKVIHDKQSLRVYTAPGQASRSIPLSFVAHFSAQVADALSFMHRLNIVHRDLTPANVLLTEDLTVKVAEMGLSRQSSKWMSPGVVTVHYRAPELLQGCGEYTCAIDMWSLGVMIADAMEGRPVFLSLGHGCTIASTYELIVMTLHPKDPLCASVTPSGPADVMPHVMKCELVKRIVFRLLAFCQNERLLAHELLQDTEWMRVATMTSEDKDVVRQKIRQTEERD